MKCFGELSEAIVKLKRLSSTGGSQLVHDEQFRRAVRKLADLEEGRTIGRKELLRAVSVIARVLCEEQLKRKDETR